MVNQVKQIIVFCTLLILIPNLSGTIINDTLNEYEVIFNKYHNQIGGIATAAHTYEHFLDWNSVKTVSRMNSISTQDREIIKTEINQQVTTIIGETGFAGREQLIKHCIDAKNSSLNEVVRQHEGAVTICKELYYNRTRHSSAVLQKIYTAISTTYKDMMASKLICSQLPGKEHITADNMRLCLFDSLALQHGPSINYIKEWYAKSTPIIDNNVKEAVDILEDCIKIGKDKILPKNPYKITSDFRTCCEKVEQNN